MIPKGGFGPAPWILQERSKGLQKTLLNTSPEKRAIPLILTYPKLPSESSYYQSNILTPATNSSRKNGVELKWVVLDNYRLALPVDGVQGNHLEFISLSEGDLRRTRIASDGTDIHNRELSKTLVTASTLSCLLQLLKIKGHYDHCILKKLVVQEMSRGCYWPCLGLTK